MKIRKAKYYIASLSGGKDSLTLLHILKNYQKFSPQKFELIAITLNPGGVDNSPLYTLCENLEVPFYEIQTDIKEIVFDIRKEIVEHRRLNKIGIWFKSVPRTLVKI